MGKSKTKSGKDTPAINCLEVLIPRMYLDTNVDNICWTLSVYSLENAPVKSLMNHSDAFHFMVYDWRRTIKKLLERYQIPFSVVRSFTFDSISSAAAAESCVYTGDSAEIINTLNRPLGKIETGTLLTTVSRTSPEKKA